ncbi:MAG TPA: [FeFe] hydrogenase H-cluster maturation GTPase HydF [Clostridia bacterium]|nr:[FeFe] hydrogenase H-cluster maturation GTPase HydF [Clostridia bacterium]
MNETPTANRFVIGLFGRRNTGKSSLINAITGQPIAVTSEVAGTTTDPVRKAMELLPIGPVLLVDTAGLDDVGALGKLRIDKTYEVLRKCNLALVVTDAEHGITSFESNFIKELKRRDIKSICVINQCDKHMPDAKEAEALEKLAGIPLVCASALNGTGIDAVKRLIIENSNSDDVEPELVRDIIHPGDVAVLVTPIDKAAPKGRLILPQQQTIRDIIETGATAVITKEYELKQSLESLKNPPAIVITDSQAFQRVAADTPENVPLTSFSILFARQKADLVEMVRGVRRIKSLASGDRVLIVEGCTHHRQDGDIGTVKIPRWIRQLAGDGIEFEWSSGAGYPADISGYSVIIHCGACMLNRKEMQYRVDVAREQGVCITNYGVLIAYVLGILPRALGPFPEALRVLEESSPEGRALEEGAPEEKDLDESSL